MASRTILVVDSDIAFTSATSDALSATGLTVDISADVQAAGARVAAGEVDVLLADSQIDGSKDLRFFEQILTLRPEQQIILVSAQPTVETAMRAVQLNIAAYLVKPLQTKELLQNVETAVEQAVLTRTLQRARDRVRAWSQELDSATQALRSSAAKASLAKDAFLMLSMGNVVGVMKDIKAVVDARSEMHAESIALQKLGCPPPLSAASALRDTIATLARTKDAFRSRELGDLRKRLEALFSGEQEVEIS